jgi:hypothetical protein
VLIDERARAGGVERDRLEPRAARDRVAKERDGLAETGGVRARVEECGALMAGGYLEGFRGREHLTGILETGRRIAKRRFRRRCGGTPHRPRADTMPTVRRSGSDCIA